ncbi:trigger factor [Motiliproteus coralliicola]|uniref:Trigger factor n=1 Tax=Motiliproteus coralliicola TaxID=2283196 RepID=A0A369WQ86_9GAMM|nr:trigger factor [Motiliproteus coralliicola]RDE24240.1 trigger factor [Motiliproteus coralliicola]
MQVSVEATSSLERQMTVTVPAERIEDDVNSRLKQTARTARIDGFRPGKVPMKVLKRRYGAGVRQEVLGEVIQQSFYEAVTQEKLKPAGGPNIEPKQSEEGQDFQYVATFEVYPEIALADYSAAEIVKETSEVADADVEEMVETLRKQHSTFSDVERASEDGDQLNIDFEGFKDGEAFEGGKAEGHDLVIGSSTMIPGFEDGLVGKSAGEELELELTFPEQYHSEELAGQAVVFKVKVNKVSAPELPELDAEFFNKFGIEESDLDGFKGEIRNNMEREVKQALHAKLKNKVLNELVNLNDIDVPQALIDGEVDRLRQQAVQQFGGGANIDASALPAELFADQAKRRVSIGLLVGELIQANELKADADRVRSTIEEMAQTYQQPQEVIDYYYGNQEQLAQVEALVLEDQVVDLLASQAKVTEEAVSYQDAIKPAQPEEAEEAPEAEEEKAEAAE